MKLQVYILLVAFALLSAPKSLFHFHENHDHGHVCSDYSDNDDGEFNEKCYACDIDLSELQTPVLVPVSLNIEKNKSEESSYVLSEESSITVLKQGRAPPMIA